MTYRSPLGGGAPYIIQAVESIQRVGAATRAFTGAPEAWWDGGTGTGASDVGEVCDEASHDDDGARRAGRHERCRHASPASRLLSGSLARAAARLRGRPRGARGARAARGGLRALRGRQARGGG